MKNKTIVQKTLCALSLYICSISANRIDFSANLNRADSVTNLNLHTALELSSQIPKLPTSKTEAAQKIQKKYRQYVQKKLATINALKKLITETQDGKILFEIKEYDVILDLLNQLDLEEKIIFNKNSISNGFTAKELIQLLNYEKMLSQEEKYRNEIMLEAVNHRAEIYNQRNKEIYNS